jgi:S1-C subfamily serine protease
MVKKVAVLVSIVATAVYLTSGVPVLSAEDAADSSRPWMAMAKKRCVSVENVKSNATRSMLDVLVDSGHVCGTGVILSKDRVLTNSHILGPDSEYHVDGRPARLIGRSVAADLALLAVDTESLPVLRLRACNKVGVEVFCVGNPGQHRTIVVPGHIVESDAEFVYTDAFHNIEEAMGASGSGVYSEEGLLVGLKKGMLRDPSGSVPVSACIPATRISQFLVEIGQGRLVHMTFATVP